MSRDLGSVAYNQLLTIVGPELALEIERKLGGRQIRIRKRAIRILEIYRARKEEFAKYTIRQLSERLGCSRTYAKLLRAGKR